MREQQIRNIIKTTLGIVGMDLEIKRERCGINMTYNFILHYIGFDPARIGTAVKEFQPSVTMEEYVKTFTLHELGHALDRKALLDSLERTIEMYELKQNYTGKEIYSSPDLLGMLLEEHEMNLTFEATAWDHAEKLNGTYGMVDWPVFRKIKYHGLLTYQKAYEKDLILYEKILSGQPDGQIA